MKSAKFYDGELPPVVPADEAPPAIWPTTRYELDMAIQKGQREGYLADAPTLEGEVFLQRMRLAGFSYRGSDGQTEYELLSLAGWARVHVLVILLEIFGHPKSSEEHRASLHRLLRPKR